MTLLLKDKNDHWSNELLGLLFDKHREQKSRINTVIFTLKKQEFSYWKENGTLTVRWFGHIWKVKPVQKKLELIDELNGS